MSLHQNGDNSYFLLLQRKSLRLKADNGNFNFPTQFHLGGTSNRFDATESTEVSFNGKVSFFSRLQCY